MIKLVFFRQDEDNRTPQSGDFIDSVLILLLSCRFKHHVVKLKYDLRSAFRRNSTWDSFQMEDLRMS